MAHSDYLVYGGDLLLFVGSTPIAYSTSSKLSVSLKTYESSSKDSANWTEKQAGRFDWNCSTDALMGFSATGTTLCVEDLWASFTGRSLVNIAFASKTGTSPSWTIDSSKKQFTGTALITAFDFTGNDGETATYSISLEGSGALTLS